MNYFNNIKSDNLNLTFELNNVKVNLGLTNALRRIMLSEIPRISFDPKSVIFYTNTSMLHNDYLLQRLLFIPLKQEKIDDYDLEKIDISLEINNNSDISIDINTDKFVVKYEDEVLNNDDIFQSTELLFTKLKPNQELSLSAKLKKGIAKDTHASLSQVSMASVFFKRDEKLIQKTINELGLSKNDADNFMLAEADKYYLRTANQEPAIYIYNIESIGILKPEKILALAMEILDDKLSFLLASINEGNEDKIIIQKGDTLFESFDFLIIDEDSTLGNLIDQYLKIKANISYAGYLIPHPNDNKLVIRTTLKNNNNLEENKKNFIETVDDIKKIVANMHKEWNIASTTKPTAKKVRIKVKKT